MDEIRARKLEIEMINHKRRLDDHDILHQKSDARMTVVDKRVDVLTENTLAVVHLTETVNSLIEALTFVSKIAKSLLAIGAFMTAAWVAARHLWDHS